MQNELVGRLYHSGLRLTSIKDKRV